MAAAGFIGLLLISAGPVLVVWCSFIAKKSFLVLLALASAFFWLLTLLVVALLFRVFEPLPEHAAVYGIVILVAVALQEAFRYCAFLMHRQIVQQLQSASQSMRLPAVTESDKQLLALTQGMGHALAQNTFLYYSFVFLAAGRGTKYVDRCPQMSYFMAEGLLSLAFFMLHCASMVVAFQGYERKKVEVVGAVAGYHLLVALTTLFSMSQGGCVASACTTLIGGSLAAGIATNLCWSKHAVEERTRQSEDERSRDNP